MEILVELFKNLQEVYDKFIKTVNFSIKQLLPLVKHHRKSKTYPFSIKNLLREKLNSINNLNQIRIDHKEVQKSLKRILKSSKKF